MHIEQLEYVVEVAKRGNISKAAEKLHVSHSAISQAISNLESEIGISIFNRSRTGTTITENGLHVVNLIVDILDKINELREISNSSNLIKKNISISASSIYFATILPEVLNKFKKENPDVQIEIDSNISDNIIEKVKESQIDIGLILGSREMLNEISGFVEVKIIYTAKLMATVSSKSPLANNKVITAEQLLQYPLIIRNERSSIRYWENLISKVGKGEVLFYTNNDEVIKNVVANDMAVGLLSDLMKTDPLVLRGDIRLIPFLIDNEEQEYFLYYIRTKNKFLSKVESYFVDSLLTTIKEFKQKIN